MVKNFKIINLRAMAILIVVFGHSIIIFDPAWGVYKPATPSFFFECIKELIDGFQMHLYFSISGFLYFYSAQKKNQDIMNFGSNKARRLLLPFIIVGLLYMIPIRILIDTPNYKNKNIVSILLNFITLRDSGHLWFLPILFLIFLLAILIQKLLLGKNYMLYIVLLTALCMNVVSSFMYKVPIISLTFKWFLFFMIGYSINKYSKFIFSKRPNFLFICLVILYPVVVYLRLQDFKIWNLIIRLFYSVSTVILFYKYIRSKYNSTLTFIDTNSYGIYLFHSPILYILMSKQYILHPIAIVSLNFSIAILTSISITILLRKIKLNLIIGE